MDALVVVFGLGVGVLVGMTGIGGGSLMAPLLILVVGTPPVVAVGTDLAYGALTKTVGGWRHWRQGNVDLPVVGWLAAGSLPGSLVGVMLVATLDERYGERFESVLLAAVGATLVVVAAVILLRALFAPGAVARETHTARLTTGRRAAAVGMGAGLGLVIGITSLGSGALIALALILVFRLTPHRVVGTDVFHAGVLLWAAGLAHLVAGNVDLGLMLTILVGSIPGVWFGTSVSARVPQGALRVALGCVLLASAIAILDRAGSAA